MKSKPQIYPLLIAISPVLGLFADNYYEATFADVIRSLIAITAFIVVFYTASNLMVGNLQKAALLTLIPVLVLFAFRPAQLLVVNEISNYWNFFVSWIVAGGVLYIVGALILRKQKALPAALNSLMTWIGIALVIAPIGNIAYIALTTPDVGKKTESEVSLRKEIVEKISSTNNKPDIYYILLDGHGREDILKSRYNLEEVRLVDSLRNMGFFISDKAVANYSWTHLSLSSTLNMTYLDEQLDDIATAELKTERGRQRAKTGFFFFAMVAQARTFLYSRGYTLMGNLFGGGLADYASTPNFFTRTSLNQFETVLVKNTALENILDQFSVSTHYQKRRSILIDLRALPELAKLDFPKFVFVHILSPHSPFVFNESGGALPSNDIYDTVQRHYTQREIDGWEEWYRINYAATVQGLGVHVTQAIKGILANSIHPPIIIVQSDHGPRLGLGNDLDSSDVEERMSVLSAFYLPGVSENDFPLPRSSVNTFRMIFDHYFEQDLPPLEDRSFFSTGSFKMYDVTDRVLPEDTGVLPP
jgi:hypothetical protein